MIKERISKNKIKNIGKDANIDRVSAEAVEIVQYEMTMKTRKLLAWAKTFAGHAGRKTIKKEDIKLALDRL